MKLEPRYTRNGDHVTLRGLVLISENKDESKLIDECFGDRPITVNGEVGTPRQAQARLSDGYGDHYIYIAAETD